MQLNKEEEKKLIDWGFSEQDIKQIRRLRYTFTLYPINNTNSKKISTILARELLSNEDFLSGLGRAAFHRTASRECLNKNTIIIESNL